MNTMRRIPISLEDYRKKSLEKKAGKFVYSNSVGGYVPYKEEYTQDKICREINSDEIRKILDEER